MSIYLCTTIKLQNKPEHLAKSMLLGIHLMRIS
jgi:hypothetical protein